MDRYEPRLAEFRLPNRQPGRRGRERDVVEREPDGFVGAQATAGQQADVGGDGMRSECVARTELPSSIHQPDDVVRTEKPRGRSARTREQARTWHRDTVIESLDVGQELARDTQAACLCTGATGARGPRDRHVGELHGIGLTFHEFDKLPEHPLIL